MQGTQITSWGLCLPDCPYIVPEVVCLDPPAVPKFGSRNSTGAPVEENYSSTWFNLNFIDNSDGSFNLTHYSITRAQRDILYQPLTPYDASQLVETSLSFIATSKDDHFNDVYQIMPNDTSVEYECPLGWVFQDSHNISHFAYCRNWTWIIDFDTSKPCVRKFIFNQGSKLLFNQNFVAVVCKEEDILKFPDDSAVGTLDVEERKAEDPINWNIFRKRLTYTCPVGHLIERPNGDYSEQPDPIPEDPYTFEVECAEDARWTPRPLHGGTVMPRCIRRNKFCLTNCKNCLF